MPGRGDGLVQTTLGKFSVKRRLRRTSSTENHPSEKKQKTDFTDGSVTSQKEVCGKMNAGNETGKNRSPLTSLNSAFRGVELAEKPSSASNKDSTASKGSSICYSEISQPSGICFEVKNIERNSDEVRLFLQEKESSVVCCCTLRGFWIDTKVQENDTVNVLAPFIDGRATIDDTSGLLVVNPDRLVSSTAIVSTLFCKRKAVLAEIFRGWDRGNFSMVLGNIVHRLFQTVLLEKSPTEDSVLKILESLLKEKEFLSELHSLKKSQAELQTAAQIYIPEILTWVGKYCSSSTPQMVEPTVTQVVDIEENIWSPRFGLKGKVDASLRISINHQEELVPLELKTGKPTFSSEHQGQVILYTMMMSRDSDSVKQGLLLYLLGGPQMRTVESKSHLQRGLIQMRNDLRAHLNQFESCREHFLPDPIDRYKACSKCPYVLPCTVLRRSVGEQDDVLIRDTAGHLSDADMKYFSHWFNLLRLEWSVQDKGCFWRQSACEREGQGNCLSSMVLRDMNGRIHSFCRQTDFHFDKSLCQVGFSVGDNIIVSLQESMSYVAMATGSVTEINDQCVKVHLERDLECRWKDQVFRLDRHSSSGTTNFWNLIRLMSDDSEATRLRRLIVKQETPAFEAGLSKEVVLRGRHLLRPLNLVQQRAVLQALMAKDYVLIRGMPGTGKTSTIVAMVQLFVTLGKSVLLTSYTHSAVDNILLKLKAINVPFLRLGVSGRVHPELRQFTFDHLSADISTVSELNSFYCSKPVVAATCFGVRDSLFANRHFDVCIVDEASQVLETACLGPLFHAKTFCLLGDPKQLPPVVQSKEAQKLGLDRSLFSKLESLHSTVDLNVQYRMNKEIMRLCNELTYEGALCCGSDQISSATLILSDSVDDPKRWWGRVLSPRLEDAVVFCDTDAIQASDDLTCNRTEAQLVERLVSCLLERGVSGDDIGVVTPFRNQVNLLRALLLALKSNVEVNTIDQYQGRDKAVIILSCVRNRFVPGDILEDEQRLNVALTRAKHKLIILGSKRTLSQYSPFSRLLQMLRSDQMFELPADALADTNKCSSAP